MVDWRRSTAVALVSIALFAIGQLAIPVSRLGRPYVPERFAWQMFSNVPISVEFVVETSSGREEVDPGRYLVQDRADLDLTRWMPSHLCDVVSDAVRVTWDDGELECSTG